MLSILAFELLLGRVSQLLVGIEAGLDSRGPSGDCFEMEVQYWHSSTVMQI